MDKSNIKKLIVILAVCIILFIGIKAGQFIIEQAKIKPVKINQKKLEKIELVIPASSVHYFFVKRTNTWVGILAGTPVEYLLDAKIVESQLVSGIANIKLTDIVSENSEKYNQYQVDDTANGVIIKLYYTGNEKQPGEAFIIGKPGFDNSSVYFRYFNKKEIWLAKGIIRQVLENNLDYWREKCIYKADQTQIESVKFAPKGFELVLKGSDWYVIENGKEEKADSIKVLQYVQGISNFKIDGFPGAAEKFTKPEYSITIKTKDKTNQILISGVTKFQTRYVKLDTGPAVYFINEPSYNNFKKNPVDFK